MCGDCEKPEKCITHINAPNPAVIDVAHQSHYEDQREQPIEYMEKSMPHDQFIGFLKGNIIKYVSRFEKKDGVRDLEKAKVYTTWLIEYIKDGKIKVRE